MNRIDQSHHPKLVTDKLVTDGRTDKVPYRALSSRWSQKPGSKHKSDLLDHISEAYNLLSAKYGNGLHFCIAGDTNELKLDAILNLNPNLVQVVNKPTRIDAKTGAEAILDPIITTLAHFYQEPLCLDPLDCDPDKNGTKSDHRIVVFKPINVISNETARITREIKVRPIPKSGIDQMRQWLMDQTWNNVYEAESAHDKAEIFQKCLLEQFEKIFPEKTRNSASADGGPRSRVRARGTLCSAPHRH